MGGVHVAQGGDIQHNGLPHRGGEQNDDDTPQGVLAIPQPVDVLFDEAGALQDKVQDTSVVIVHPLPHHGDGHRAGDHRQVKDAPEGGEHRAAELINSGGDPEGKGTDGGNADDYDNKGVAQRLQEGLIAKELLKV